MNAYETTLSPELPHDLQYRIAVEGLGGSGKSHVIRLLTDELANAGYTSITHKIGGIGDGPYVSHLRVIRDSREQLRNTGGESEEHKIDRLMDRVYLLAQERQARHFLSSEQNQADVVIFDRTPLMSWVHASAVATMPDSEPNPYLAHIMEKNLGTASRLSIDRVILLDLAPEVAYARTIARYFIGSTNASKEIEEALDTINAPPSSRIKIGQMVLTLMERNKELQKKHFESWHITDFRVNLHESQFFHQAMQIMAENLGCKVSVVNAEAPIHDVVSDVMSAIRDDLTRLQINNTIKENEHE